MDELEITKDLIRVLAFYGILKDWDMYELLDEYEHLGIPIVLVNETLREGVEYGGFMEDRLAYEMII